MILSLLYRKTPAECRFLMIDPKMLELSVYNDIPHLLSPVITDPQQAVAALNWAVGEMEERYKRMAELGVRNIDAFNTRVKHAKRALELGPEDFLAARSMTCVLAQESLGYLSEDEFASAAESIS